MAVALTSLSMVGSAGCSQPEEKEDVEPDKAGSSKTAASAKAARVETAVLELSPAQLSLKLPGEVEGQRDALLSASMGGYIEAVHVEVGDVVREGQILANVDSATHGSRLSQAKVEYDAALREWERAKKLGDVLPGAERDAAESRYLAAKAALDAAGVQLSRAVVTAPFAGTVSEVEAEKGEVAAPGAPLFRLIQLDPANVTVSLSDRDVGIVHKGMAVRVTPDAGSTMFEGTVSRVRPAADIRTRSFTAEIEVPNPDERLLPGMIVSVRVSTPEAKEQLVISQDFLVTKLDGLGLFVNQDGKAAWRSVELGSVIRRQVVVESGLEAGDEIVVVGHRELADGDPLIVSRKGRCCEEGRVVFESETEASP